MNQIREHRIASGLTLSEAAKKLATDAGNLSRVERGSQWPSVELAKRMSSLYGMSLDEIFAEAPRDTAA